MVIRVHGGILNDQMIAGSLRYFDIEEATMTANAIADAGAQIGAVRILDKGTGWTVNDVLTLQGGTFSVAATLTVDTVDSNGTITSFSISERGAYTVIPANPITVTGGTGTPKTDIVEVDWWSTIIIPGAGNSLNEYFVPYEKPVTGSAVDQVLAEVAKRANIVQVAIADADTVRIAVENTAFAWDTEAAGDAAAEMQAAIQALGVLDVPDTTNTGGTFDVSAATVTERTFATFT